MPARFRLDRLLEQAGISQRELGRRSGVSPTTINRMAANLTAQVSLRTLDALARVLGVEPGDIIESVPAKTKRATLGRAQVRHAAISELESGKRQRVNLDILERLALALGVEPGELLQREGKRKRGK